MKSTVPRRDFIKAAAAGGLGLQLSEKSLSSLLDNYQSGRVGIIGLDTSHSVAFTTGIPPVRAEETIEIFTFMAAAEESKFKGGKPVGMAPILAKALKNAQKTLTHYLK
jgi:hypothetical protein